MERISQLNPEPCPLRPFASGRHGLTLFELLTVMMILSLLVSLVIGLGRYADTIAKRHHAIADLGKWQDALQRYYDVLGQYPDSQYNGSVAKLLSASAQIGGSNVVCFSAQFSTPPNAIDPWFRPYQYVAPSNNAPQSFDLYSFGPCTNIASDDIRFQP